MASGAAFAAVAVTLYAGHQLADHVLGQTDRQASGKAEPGWAGWRHIIGHVALYHAVVAAMLLVAVAVLDLPVTWAGAAAGLGFSAATHALIDRRWPVRLLLEATGSGPFSRLSSNGMNGIYLADQALHYACLWVSALLVVSV
ncbi:DUF3307 domain-containing protein [Micromonospora sp. CPCC 205371]|nr:DUF3307 domain-containing protein [Micromonospora sp. CPCC 205371]